MVKEEIAFLLFLPRYFHRRLLQFCCMWERIKQFIHNYCGLVFECTDLIARLLRGEKRQTEVLKCETLQNGKVYKQRYN